MELLPLVCVSLLTWSGTTFAAENVITVEEGRDVILPCSLNTMEDITFQVFDWIKDRDKASRKDLFFHDSNNNSRASEDPQFKGRVSNFPVELKSGNASITIRHTKVADSGVYTCVFPDLQPRQIFLIQLYVDGILKDRTGENIPGSASKPSFKHPVPKNLGEAQLQCKTNGFPQPELLWQDSDGNNLKAEKPQVSKQGDQFYVTLQITVYKTGVYRCVATQEEIHHQINDTTHVTVNVSGSASGLVAGSVLKLFLLMVFLVLLF